MLLVLTEALIMSTHNIGFCKSEKYYMDTLYYLKQSQLGSNFQPAQKILRQILVNGTFLLENTLEILIKLI